MAANKATTIQDLWHYAVGSERKGPVPQATLASLLAAGEISAETYVWQPGMENWVHLGDAGPLKELVAGVGGDQPIEVFVEEDTAFNTADELLAAHSALAAADEEPEEAVPAAVITEVVEDDGDDVTGDTVVESVDDVFSALTVDYDEPEEVTLVGADGAIFADAAAAVPDEDDEPEPFAAVASIEVAEEPEVIASAGEPAAAASGVDIFGDAEPDDIFAEASDEPAPIPAGGVGAHSRHANSVLFSLDDLGREDSSETLPAGGDPFVTDTSGLIDIKAIADSQEDRREYSDPFAVPSAPMASRAGVGTISVPIVERRNNLGPWILAAALVLLVGGGIVAFILMGDDTPKQDPALVAAATQPAAETKPAEVTPPPADPAKVAAVDEAKTGGDEAKTAVDEAKTGGDEAKAEGDEAKTEGDEAGPDGATDEPSDEEMKAAIAKAEAEARAKAEAAAKAARTARTRPKVRRTRPATTASAPKDPPPAARIEVAAAPKTTSSSGNTRKVNALLEKLNNPNDGAAEKDTPDTNMPKKLSAASLRQTLRQNRARFAKCGASLGADAGTVKVTTSFVIQGSSGAVQSARIINGGGTSADVQRCVVSELKRTIFGRFSDATMTVNFPIQLM